MTNQNTSLSDLWRQNKSKDAGTDLASVLDGCRILAQSLNPKVEVTFAGVKTANTDMKRIFLSPRNLGNEYPISGEKVDILLGLTVHEVGHTLFSEDKYQFMTKIERGAGIWSWDNDNHSYLEHLVNIFEDIYVDHTMTAYPCYRDYLQRERDQALGEFNSDSVTKPLEAKCTRRDILNALIYFTLAGGKFPSKITDENVKALADIAGNANKMCTKKLSKTRAILNAWKTLKAVPIALTNEDRGFGQPVPPPEEGETEPASDKANNHACDEKKEQEKLESQESDDGEEEPEPEETDEGDKKGEQDEEEPEPEDSEQGEGESEEESGEIEPSDTYEEGQETEEEEGEGESIESGENEASDDTESDNGEEDGGEGETGDEIEPDPDLDLSSMIEDLVKDNTRLPDDLADDVSEAIIEKKADLTQLLSLLANDSNRTIVAYTPGENAEAAAEARSQTAEAEEILRRILQDYRIRRTKDYRGLMEGRISSRRLQRAAYGDKRVFQRREKPEEIDMAICLLMDLSGSVHRHQTLIEQIICAICDAFQKEKVEFIALGYSSGGGGVVNIPRLYDREVGRVNLSLDKEWGSTPSYEGIAAAMAQLLRLTGKKEKVLFHFTDGEPDFVGGRIIPDLLDDARARGITDIHICLGGKIENFKALYGEGALQITDINQLPEVIEAELRQRLQV